MAKRHRTQGQSKNTARKEDGFYTLFKMILRVTKNKWYPYWHLDLNCGCGWNHEVNCPGSPLMFLQAAIEVCRIAPIYAYFCDIEPQRIVELQARCFGMVKQLLDGSTIHATAMDNAAFLTRMDTIIRAADRRPELATGTILLDCNGFPDGFPVDALDSFLAHYRRLDLILYVNCSLFARVHGINGKGGAIRSKSQSERFLTWPTLEQLLPRFHKDFWTIRNPSRGGKSERFLTFWGRNNPNLARGKFQDFFPLESLQGQTILHLYEWVNPDQPYLFEDKV